MGSNCSFYKFELLNYPLDPDSAPGISDPGAGADQKYDGSDPQN